MSQVKQEVVKPNLIEAIKKKQIIDEIHQANPSIPQALLDMIWDSVKKMDDRKLKQLKKGTYKFKPEQKIKRREYKDGEVIKQSVEIMENAVVPMNNIIELKDDDNVEDGFDREAEETPNGLAEGNSCEAEAEQGQESG